MEYSIHGLDILGDWHSRVGGPAWHTSYPHWDLCSLFMSSAFAFEDGDIGENGCVGSGKDGGGNATYVRN